MRVHRRGARVRSGVGGVGAAGAVVPGASAGAGWSVGFPDGRWLVTANVLFLHSIARARGTDHPTVAGNLEAEPETAALVVELEPDALVDSGSIATALPAVWDRVVAAATRRAERVGRTAG